MGSSKLLSIIIISVLMAVVTCERVPVMFQGKLYNVTSGCHFKNPDIVRWHQFCMVLQGDKQVCTYKGRRKSRKIVPRYSNICDAMCHVSYSKSLKICPTTPGEKAKNFNILNHSKVPKPSRVILEYGKTGYIVTTGCKTKDFRIKRFYGLCLSEYSGGTICRKDTIPGLTLTFPEYTDVCSAMCHNNDLRGLNFCPVRGEIFQDDT